MAAPDALRATLAQPPPVLVVVGDEGLLVREAVAAVRDAVAAGPMAAFNHAAFSCAEDNARGFADAARTVPMMAARRLVELGQVQDAPAALLDLVLEYFGAPAPSTVLLLHGERFPAAREGMDRGLRIQNAAKKVGAVFKLDGKGTDPVRFALERARALGVGCERGAAEALVALGGGDLGVLAADVEKCADYVGAGGTITAAVADEVVAPTADADAWALTDALVARDRDRALATLHRLLEDQEPPHKLLGSVAWQLRQVLQLQDAMRRGLPEQVAMPPHKLRLVREMVQKRPLSPSQVLEELAAGNRAMNSSRAGDRRVFEALVLRLLVG